MIQSIQELDYDIMRSKVFKVYGRIKYDRGTLDDIEDCFHDTWEVLLSKGLPDDVNPVTGFMAKFRQLNYDRYVRNRSGITYTSDALFENPDDLYGEYVNVTMELPTTINTRKVRDILTYREWEVYSLLSSKQEYNQKEVALVLGVSPQAVADTLTRLSNKIRGLG